MSSCMVVAKSPVCVLPTCFCICQVTKATEAKCLDQRRLLLSVNHKGTILQVNAGQSSVFCMTLLANCGLA